MTAAITGLKKLIIPDSTGWFLDGQPTDAFVHMMNDINAAIGTIQNYQAPVIPDPHDPPVWELIETRAVDGDEVFTDLDSYQSLIIVLANVNISSSGRVGLRVSTDNSTFLGSSGDYFNALGDGGKTNLTEIALNSINATTAIYSHARIDAFSLAAPKPVMSAFGTNFTIASASALKAIKIFGTAGALSSGTIYLSGLPGLS